ncbi:MAG: hypothetical protein DMG24_06620 [Acidobacteria bacterium]|nr:MAG: hypothetical protein DMG24_06620 [Acidobacteriota bacterium]
MRYKFNIGDRVSANEKAPGDYSGLIGTVLGRGRPGRSEYKVQFDDDLRGPGWLCSWQLDRTS